LGSVSSPKVEKQEVKLDIYGTEAVTVAQIFREKTMLLLAASDLLNNSNWLVCHD